MISVCTSDPCKNNGTCLFDVANNSYQCDCADEFAGLHCELVVTESVVNKPPVDATESEDSGELIVTESVVSKPAVDATLTDKKQPERFPLIGHGEVLPGSPDEYTEYVDDGSHHQYQR